MFKPVRFASITLVLALILTPLPLVFAKTSKEIYQKKREEMVTKQIEARGVKDEKVLEAMRKVPRHKFVSDKYKSSAYYDRPLPIECGQTISQPYIVGLMSELLEPKRKDKVLEVGTGSGYQAAVLSPIVKKVYTIEIFEELGTSAKKRLNDLGYKNVEVKIADGYYGWEENAPFDCIIVTCAAGYVPPPLLEQLKEGGRMVIPVGAPFLVQSLMLIEKKNGKIISHSICPVRFVPLLGKH
ncbi:protein-L-isoaspartate(D-aspartate) O-methyltransferase [Patescibacteria group bacterium]|nr:protein-L-isoaspartate(D-aspartate) O-methyltransferase [Patescibacteria group bacterium]